jgi:hypothetical protein
MKIHLSPILKNKNLIKYILIGILNTIFAYISGIVFFHFKIIKAYEFKFNSIYSNNELNDKIKENLNYQKSFVSIVHCDTNVRLTPSLGTKLLENGDMISDSLDKQKD